MGAFFNKDYGHFHAPLVGSKGFRVTLASAYTLFRKGVPSMYTSPTQSSSATPAIVSAPLLVVVGLAAGFGLAWAVTLLVQAFGHTWKILIVAGVGAFVISVTIGLVWLGYSYSKRGKPDETRDTLNCPFDGMVNSLQQRRSAANSHPGPHVDLATSSIQ